MPTKPTARASKATSSPLSRINNIVVVMLENRSFDHMLGYLYADGGNKSPLGQPFEGLTGNESNPDGKGATVKVFPIQGTSPHPYFYPGANPGEGYQNTNAELFGKNQAPNPIVPATNQGFVTNFAATLAWESKETGKVLPGTTASQIMGMYTPALLPILSNLGEGICGLRSVVRVSSDGNAAQPGLCPHGDFPGASLGFGDESIYRSQHLYGARKEGRELERLRV